MNNTIFRLLPVAAVASILCACGGSNPGTPTATTTTSTPPAPTGNKLLVSRSAYDPGFTVAGQLPYNGNPAGTGTAASPSAQ
jgi:hypothetical protein